MTKPFAWAALVVAMGAGCGTDDLGASAPLTQDAASPRRDGGKDAARDTGKEPAPMATDCRSSETQDFDEDGFTRAEGDCDDCRAEVNPGAFDFPTDDVDNDCSGSAAKSDKESCDEGLAIDDTDAKNGARAIGLCNFAEEDSKSWGVISARYTNASGEGKITNAKAAGLLPSFGAAKPTHGETLLALSSGVARAPDQPGYTSDCDLFDSVCLVVACTNGNEPPAGYPKESSVCKGPTPVFDLGTFVYNAAALELKIRVPNNVKSLSFDSIFYTYEYPKFICQPFNDFFVVFKEPKPSGVSDGNIVFDSNGDPIGVNTGLLSVCDPSGQEPEAAKQFSCDLGTSLLEGTGFGPGESECQSGPGGGASTGWLHTTAPVEPGQVITLRFAIWDTKDATVDSSVVIDNFKWSSDGSDVETTPILVI